MKVKISPLSLHPEFHSSILEFAGEIFSQSEPITVEVKAQANEFTPTLKARLPSYIKHSSVAYNPENMQLLGVLLSSDAAYVSDTVEVSPNLQLIFSLLDQCSEMYFKLKGIDPATLKENTVFYQEIIAVSLEGKGNQIGAHLFAHNLQLGKILNFKDATTDTTSQKSTALGIKCGYEEIGEIIYSDAIVNGTKYYKNLTDPTADRVKVLSMNLDKYDLNSLKKNENIEYIF